MSKLTVKDIELHVALQMAKHRQELREDKLGMESRYNGVRRINCENGYVDIRSTRSRMLTETDGPNGQTFSGSVNECREMVRRRGISIYNYEEF